MKKLLVKLLREPLLHFCLLGALLYALQASVVNLDSEARAITVSQAEQARLQARWQRATGRQPSAEEMTALLRQHVDEELMLREARRLGLDQRDPVVRQRLLRNMRFIDPDSGRSESAQLRSARQLGMAQTDLVVRRRLLQLMRHRYEGQADLTVAELLEHYSERKSELSAPARYSFQQIYFAEPVSEQRIATAQHSLRQGKPAIKLGDPFLQGYQFAQLTPQQIERRFGSDFVALLKSAPQGEWFGPVRSAYGKHLLRLESIQAAPKPSWSDIAPRLSAEARQQQEQQRLRQALDELRERYPVEVEASPS